MAAAGSSQCDVGVVGLTSATAGRDGGIALTYDYSKFPLDKITVPKLLKGWHDLITWTESIEPQLETVGLESFADGDVETPHKADVELLAEFRTAHVLTFIVISRCYLPMIQGKRGKSGGGGSGGGKLAKEAVGMKSARDSSRGSGGRRRECWVCGDPDHLYYECPDLEDSENNDKRGGRRRFVGGRPRQDNKPRKEKQLTKQSSLVKDADSSYGGKARCDGEALCSMVDIVEPTVLLASEAGEEFKAVAAAVLANPSVWLTWLAS
ncbi:unnamed protein product [Closterium sp. NIES-53]